MTIHIEGLSLEVIIGLLDFEREKTQQVIVNLEASYDYKEGYFIDYAQMATAIHTNLKEKRYLLLEEALLGLQVLLCATFQGIQTLHLKLSKPDILPNCTVSLSKTWNF